MTRGRQMTVGVRGRHDAGVRTASLALVWATLLWLTLLWEREGGLEGLTGWSDALLSVGRLAGLSASALLLVQVLLMARLPVLERAWGRKRLVRLHRRVGFTSFHLMLAHVGLITWGYAGASLLAVPRTTWRLVVDHPGMLLAAAGSVCLVLVVATSVRAARRRLRHESWHLIHLYAYLGAGLALPHQLWTGSVFVGSTASTVFWWGLWIAAAGAVLVWRVALPLRRSGRPGRPGRSRPGGRRAPGHDLRFLGWAVSAAVVLVLLLGYRTSLSGVDRTLVAGTPLRGSVGPTEPAATRTVTGPVVVTRYGPVQVELGMSGAGPAARIVGVSVLRYPHTDGTDAHISGFSLPVLIDQTLDLQSAEVDVVSGATQTSDGYRASLQAALDEARA